MNRSAYTCVLLTLLTLTMLFRASSALADDGGDITGANRHNGGVVIGGSSGTPAQPVGTTPKPTTRTITCDLTGHATAQCQGAATACLRPPLAPPTNAAVTEHQQPDGSWRQIGVDCNGDGADDALAVTAAMVRQEVVRLLPPVEVGVAPATGPTLVNLETIFWSPTAATRQLGPVTILGQRVAITIRFDHASYDYGDGTTATADSVTARSTITWTASFTVGGGAEQPIPGTIDGPTSEHDLQVLEGRSILVR